MKIKFKNLEVGAMFTVDDVELSIKIANLDEDPAGDITVMTFYKNTSDFYFTCLEDDDIVDTIKNVKFDYSFEIE